MSVSMPRRGSHEDENDGRKTEARRYNCRPRCGGTATRINSNGAGRIESVSPAEYLASSTKLGVTAPCPKRVNFKFLADLHRTRP